MSKVRLKPPIFGKPKKTESGATRLRPNSPKPIKKISSKLRLDEPFSDQIVNEIPPFPDHEDE
ncbi:MAG: hypothetical protein ACR9NN_21250 [Nostochopsis sp.]